MNNLITLAFAILSFSFNTRQPEINSIIETIIDEKPVIFKEFSVNQEDYTLSFKLEKITDNKHFLIINIDLHNNASYRSPNKKSNIEGKFNMDLGSYKDLGFKGDLIETSLPLLEYNSNPFNETATYWVKTDTSYKQQLELKTSEDFQVFGRIQFTIEPRHRYEETPFSIIFEDGELVFVDAKC